MNKLFVVMLLHAGVQMLLVLGTNRIVGSAPGYIPAVVASVLGGIYSGACMIPGFYFLGNGFWRLLSLIMMAYIAFPNSGKLRRGALFVLLSLSVSAITLGSRSVLAMLLAMLAVGLLCVLGVRGTASGEFVPVTFHHAGQQISVTALRDTGNNLRDPITGRSVLIVDAEIATLLTGLTAEQLNHPCNNLKSLSGSRLVPYRTVGQPGGLLLAAKFQDVSVGEWRGSCLVAFSPCRFDNENFKALVGGML